MSGNFTQTLFVCLLLILTNISANADSPKIRWSNTNKTIAPEMIQVSDDGNYLHTLQNNYYKKIDLNTDSIVKVVDLRQVCINSVRTLIDYDGKSLKIDQVYYFNYPNITLLYKSPITQYVIYYNIETEEYKITEHKYGVTYMTSNENYTIFYYFHAYAQYDGVYLDYHVFLWEHDPNKVRRIKLTNNNNNIYVAAGLLGENEYWIYSGPVGFRVFNAKNDSLMRTASSELYTHTCANYRMDGDVIYFLGIDSIPLGIKFNFKTMTSESYEFETKQINFSLRNSNMNYPNYFGYYSKNYEPQLVIFDFRNNIIKYKLMGSSYFRAFDIDTTLGYLYYITESDPSKINRLNLKDSTIDKILSFDLPNSNFKIGKEILTNYLSRAAKDYRLFFSNYTLLNIDNGFEFSNYKIDTLKIKSNPCNFFYDSLSNKYYPFYFNGSNYITFDYQTKQIINNSVKDTIIPYYYIPSGVYYSSKILNTIDILSGNITDKIDFVNSGYSLLDISRNGRQIWMRNTNDYKNYYFYDLNERNVYKYYRGEFNANYQDFIGNSGNYITQNGKQVILRNFKEPQDSIILGTTNSLITTSTFSNNERMIITGDVTGKIMFWNLLTNSKSNEIDLNMDIKKIDLTLDEKGLLVLTGDGSLTMIDVEDILITDVKEKDNITADISISPNPATDFITINPGNKGLKPFAETDEQVEIYNSFGELVLADIQHLRDVGYLGRIDVSNLPVGLYFIKIGDRVEKFVKM